MYSVKRYWDGRYELLCGRRRWLAVQGETERAQTPKLAARKTDARILGYRRRLLSPHTSLHWSTEKWWRRGEDHTKTTPVTAHTGDMRVYRLRPIASRPPPKSSTKSDRFSTRPGLPPAESRVSSMNVLRQITITVQVWPIVLRSRTLQSDQRDRHWIAESADL